MSKGHGPRASEKPKNFKESLGKLIKYLGSYKLFIIIALFLAVISSICSIVGPNKIKDLTNEISKGLVVDKINFESIVKATTNDLSEENIRNVSYVLMTTNNPTVTTADKAKFFDVISKLKDDQTLIKEIPDNILLLMFKDSKINNVLVTKVDKVEFIKQASSLNQKSSATEIYKILDSMPQSIKTLVKPNMNLNTIKAIALFLLILYVISALFNYIQTIIMTNVSNKFAKELRSKISIKINKLPLKFFDNNQTGDILSRITNDVDTINMSLHNSLGSLVGAITLFIGSIIMMFITNYIMALTAIISSIIGFVFMFIILGKSQKYFNRRQVELGKLNGHIEEIYSNHNVVKAYNGEKDAKEKFDELNYSVYDCNRKSQFLSGMMMPVMGFIGNFSYVCVCVVGALLVMNDLTTFGAIVAFMIYVRLFTSPLSQIAQGFTQLQTTIAASERVFEFVEEKEMKSEKDLTKKLEKDKVKGSITFNHVKFGYDENKTIIKDFNCKVSPGEKVAIVGPTGAGKTTMVNLLMKFYEIKDGDITIDNVSTKELTRENIHDLFIMVLQDTWVFNGTIRDNIKYNNINLTDEEIWKSLQTVGLKHFIKSLPGGLDYKLTDQDSISGGQKQLLTIARGMTKNSPFLILDEATSSVDTRTEELVQIAMDKLTKGRTSFIIAHRLSTIKNADIILVMKEGNIVEQGKHEELLKKNGFYAELYNSQFKN